MARQLEGKVALVTGGAAGIGRAAAALAFAENGALVAINDLKEKQFIDLEPIGRMGTPEEIAAAAVWLCTGGASFVTGHPLAVDGGLVAQ